MSTVADPEVEIGKKIFSVDTASRDAVNVNVEHSFNIVLSAAIDIFCEKKMFEDIKNKSVKEKKFFIGLIFMQYKTKKKLNRYIYGTYLQNT